MVFTGSLYDSICTSMLINKNDFFCPNFTFSPTSLNAKLNSSEIFSGSKRIMDVTLL